MRFEEIKLHRGQVSLEPAETLWRFVSKESLAQTNCPSETILRPETHFTLIPECPSDGVALAWDSYFSGLVLREIDLRSLHFATNHT